MRFTFLFTLVFLLASQSIAQVDTMKTYYLDSLEQKKSCLLLLNKNKRAREADKLRSIYCIDSSGALATYYPKQIKGYWLKNVFYRSFRKFFGDKRVDFFAEEITPGKASLYYYDLDLMNTPSLYIFKKSFQREYYFVQESISAKSEIKDNNPKEKDESEAYSEPIAFHEEEPYLQFFQSYLADCKDVALKFRSKWYS